VISIQDKNLNDKNRYPQTIGEKLRYIRKAQEYSLEVLGFEIGYEPSMIGHIERGEAKYNAEKLEMAKEFLGVSGMPLTDIERQGFRNKLYLWRDLIKDHKFDEAKKMQKELSPITILDFDIELNLLYDLFYCRLLMKEGNFDKAREILANIEFPVDEIDGDCLYNFHYTKGVLLFCDGQYKEALEFYNEAMKKLAMNDTVEQKKLNFNTALCYFELGYSFRSIVLLENLYSSDDKSNINLSIGNTLAICWIRLGFLKKATEILSKCYLVALDNKDDDELIGILLHNHGCLYRKAKDWNLSIEYFDKAFPHFEVGSLTYLENLYQKICSLIESKNYSSCTELISEGKKLSAKVNNEKYSILFETLKHRINLSNNKSCDYVKTVTVPYLLEISDNYRASEYVELLRDRYARVRAGNAKKSLLMSELARKIYIEMLEGGELK